MTAKDKNAFIAITSAISIIAVTLHISAPIMAQNANSTSGAKGKEISPELFGLFFEDINYSADGGLYAELIQNRSFEYSLSDRKDWGPFSYWEYITPGYSYGSVAVETNVPVHPNNPHYILLNAEHIGNEKEYSGIAGVGIKNSGFDGIHLNKGEACNFSLFIRRLSKDPVSVVVMLQAANGDMLAMEKIVVTAKDWQQYSARLIPEMSSDSASLVVLVTNPGRLAMDMISLLPEKTFRNRPNGLRSDLALALADMKPRFIRFPGGCLVHGDGLGNMYRWKNTVGPLEQRVEQRNIWGYHQTMGLGYFEYFQFCEDIGAKPLPVLPAAVSCQNSGGTWRIGGTGQQALPMEEMDEYIQEVLDLIEWANGPVTSEWGAKRAAAGHPAPFNLEYVGIGNEDKITPEFEVRFKMIFDAVKARHPGITLIGTSGPFPDGDDFEKGWKYADLHTIPIIDEHYYKDPKWMMQNLNRYDTYDRSKAKVYLGEYASWGNKLINALAEAAYMIGLERNGDVVHMASYAPLLAKKDHTQWKTDMIFFDNSSIVLTPNYYVQKMFSVNSGDVYFSNVVTFNPADSALAASCVQDRISGDVIVKLVNTGSNPAVMKVDLRRFRGIISIAEQEVLTGAGDAENTFENRQHIVPEKSTRTVNRIFDYQAPPMSLSIIRIKTKR